MCKFLLLIIATFLICCNHKRSEALHIESFSISSSNTGDNYIIRVRKPTDFNAADTFHIVYAVDGSIGIGDYLLGKDSGWSASVPDNCIIITIGHKGDWNVKRQRDFIASVISKDSSGNFGKADKFYLFLKDELIPVIEKRNFIQKDRSLIGHSFGGLFCLYAALKNDLLFDHYFAISPSVWANYYELLKIEKNYSQKHTDLKAKISITVGSLEIFNKILSSSREFVDSLQSRKYKNLQVDFSTINNANHFSVRKPAIDKILQALKEN